MSKETSGAWWGGRDGWSILGNPWTISAMSPKHFIKVISISVRPGIQRELPNMRLNVQAWLRLPGCWRLMFVFVSDGVWECWCKFHCRRCRRRRHRSCRFRLSLSFVVAVIVVCHRRCCCWGGTLHFSFVYSVSINILEQRSLNNWFECFIEIWIIYWKTVPPNEDATTNSGLQWQISP